MSNASDVSTGGPKNPDSGEVRARNLSIDVPSVLDAFDDVRDPIAVFDAVGRELWRNAALRRLVGDQGLGRSDAPDELVLSASGAVVPAPAWVSPEDRAHWVQRFEALQETIAPLRTAVHDIALITSEGTRLMVRGAWTRPTAERGDWLAVLMLQRPSGSQGAEVTWIPTSDLDELRLLVRRLGMIAGALKPSGRRAPLE